MNNLETEYRVNEQGMIVEVIEKFHVNESEDEVNAPHANKNAIAEDVLKQN